MVSNANVRHVSTMKMIMTVMMSDDNEVTKMKTTLNGYDNGSDYRVYSDDGCDGW